MNQRDSSTDTANKRDQEVTTESLWRAIRRPIVSIAVLLAWAACFFGLDSLVSGFPLEQPISLDPPGTIDSRIWIPLREMYFLELEFSRQGHSFEELQQLIGDLDLPGGGVPVPIAWSLTSSATGLVVAQGTAITKGASGWGPDVYRSVDTIRVEPGRYRFHAKILNPVPELASIPTRLALGNNFKTTDTWQSSALFFGALLTVWVGTPILAGLVAWLILRVGGFYWRTRSARSRSARD